MGPVALMPLSMRGTAGGPPESREHIANALANLVTKVGEQNLKDDFRDISDEIRRQAAARNSPRHRASPGPWTT